MSHRLKCWAENFDAIASGRKRAEVRAEDDRVFAVGELLELTRTDREGKPTQPETRLLVAISHVDRMAGPHELVGKTLDGTLPVPVAVLSLDANVRQFIRPNGPSAETKAP